MQMSLRIFKKNETASSNSKKSNNYRKSICQTETDIT